LIHIYAYYYHTNYYRNGYLVAKET